MILGFTFGLVEQNAFASPPGPRETVIAYFKASREGDVSSIKSLLGGYLLKTKKTLLEENPEYSNYLINYYKGIEVEVSGQAILGMGLLKARFPKAHSRLSCKMVLVENDSMQKDSMLSVVPIKVFFPNGSYMNRAFILQRNRDYTWKIINQVVYWE
jgi:hypothetical protein